MSVTVPKVASACTQIFLPISWDQRDTKDTVKEIKEHNAVWEAERAKGN